MLELGVFEGKYINAIEGVPAAWKNIPKVLGPEDLPDPSINFYGVKSRQPLSVWKKNGWTTKNSPLGWFSWFIHYSQGRRLGAEDDWQINRWRSFVARHQGQIDADPKSKNKDHRLAQKQTLLQWGWEWKHSWSEELVSKNAAKMAKEFSVPLQELKASSESLKLRSVLAW